MPNVESVVFCEFTEAGKSGTFESNFKRRRFPFSICRVFSKKRKRAARSLFYFYNAPKKL